MIKDVEIRQMFPYKINVATDAGAGIFYPDLDFWTYDSDSANQEGICIGSLELPENVTEDWVKLDYIGAGEVSIIKGNLFMSFPYEDVYIRIWLEEPVKEDPIPIEKE